MFRTCIYFIPSKFFKGDNMYPLFNKFGLVSLTLILLLSGCTCKQNSLPASSSDSYRNLHIDPAYGHLFVLDNGLTVFMKENHDRPLAYASVVVGVGSKHDPPEYAGLAELTQSLLFNGTDRYGTTNFEKEKIYLDQLPDLYEQLGKVRTAGEREAIYSKIDSISNLAASYEIPDGHFKLLNAIGGRKTAAYVEEDRTIFPVTIPSNQVENWLKSEAERFRNPVMRGFDTELSAFYEQIRFSLDQDAVLIQEALSGELFRPHPYGTSDISGKVRHLEHPSLSRIIEFYDKWYIPANMMMTIVGDIDPARTIQLIDEYFGKLPKEPFPEFSPPEPPEIKGQITVEITDEKPESVTIGFRLPGAGTTEADMLRLAWKLLTDKRVGFLTENLIRNQKVLEAEAHPEILQDYSVLRLWARPRTGQSLEDAKNQLLAQLARIRNGDFSLQTWETVINQLKKRASRSPVIGLLSVYPGSAWDVKSQWEDVAGESDRISRITPQDMMTFAQQYLNNNFVVVYKLTGEGDKDIIQRLEKVKPLFSNRDYAEVEFSPWAKRIVDSPVPEYTPEFVDFQSIIQETTLPNGISLIHSKDYCDSRFSLKYLYDMGKLNDPVLAVALDYLKNIGTANLTRDELDMAFYRLGCDVDIFYNSNLIRLQMSGPAENFLQALTLWEELLSNPSPDDFALENLKKYILQNRQNMRDSAPESMIMEFDDLVRLGSELKKHSLADDDIRRLNSDELLARIGELSRYPHRILYSGPENHEDLVDIISKYHRTPDVLTPIPTVPSGAVPSGGGNRIYIYPSNMNMWEIYLAVPMKKIDAADIPEKEMFLQYYFGNSPFFDLTSNSIMYQTLKRRSRLVHQIIGYISGSSALTVYSGAIPENIAPAAIEIYNLIASFPEDDAAFQSARKSLLSHYRSQKTPCGNSIFQYVNARDAGVNHDIRRDIYEECESMTLDDVRKFHAEYIQDQPCTILIVGNPGEDAVENLKSLGSVEYLSAGIFFGE